MVEKKINQDDNSEGYAKFNSHNQGISHKIDNNQVDNKNDDPSKNINQIINNNETPDAIAELLIEIFGADVFLGIKKNSDFIIPFSDENTETSQWLTNAFKMIFRQEDLDSLELSLAIWNKKKNEAILLNKSRIDELERSLAVKVEMAAQAESEFINADADRKHIRKQLAASVPVDAMINMVFNTGISGNYDRIKGLLKEEMVSPSEGYASFVMQFLTGWRALNEAFQKSQEEEVVAMEKMHDALTVFLDNISGYSIPQRRPLLDIIAELCSEKFTKYRFVSPEESLQVDPRIHSATSLGGSKIKEGISFAVLKKDNLQTIKYAEVRVH